MHIGYLISLFKHKLTLCYLLCAEICSFTWLTKANSVIQNMKLSFRQNLIFKYFVVFGRAHNWFILIIAHIFVSTFKNNFLCGVYKHICLCVYMSVNMNVTASMFLSFMLPYLLFVSETESLTEPAVNWFYQTIWQASPRNPLSSHLLLYLQLDEVTDASHQPGFEVIGECQDA